MSQNNFILHGHFYQPPRENPWTGFIDRQESAYPYNDWNSRINTECYAACTRTPVFENNEIVKIINCFEYLSFNIGPTLLSWMEKQDIDPRTVEKIIEGDKISVLRNDGHGNAIAQIYSHMIMPLASERDQYTQINWGLKDFKMRFGRDSEGIWLSETAINNKTASILVDCGIKFVILSPYQAQNIITDNTPKDVLGGRVDTTQPYRLHTKNGDLTVFFYDPYLASEISFGEALGDAQRLLSMVRHSFAQQHKEIKLVHTATDGEVYGHHKSYGNMSLARMIYEITNNTNPEFTFTNYGNFLANNPPQEECELYLGERGDGSSWSCVHGVGRWDRDCGCHTGGEESWNQAWRTPLRESFDVLRDELHSIVEDQTKDLIKNIWDARDDYFTYMIKRTPEEYANFFNKHQKKELTEKERNSVMKIMEALKYAMLMYTSCGWFFSDISGIETIQDLLYAVRTYEFSKDILGVQTHDKFRKILMTAQSNIKIHKNGMIILDANLYKYRVKSKVFIEYVCWLVINEGFDILTQGTNEFTFTMIWEDEKTRKCVMLFENRIDVTNAIAFTLNKSDVLYNLLWKEVSIDDKELFTKEAFWTKDDTWQISLLSSLPLFLRVRFIARSIQFEMQRTEYRDVDENALFLNAVWGAESLLLPYEKRTLIFHYAVQIHRFARKMTCDKQIKNVDFLLREAELLKKSASSKEEAILYLEPLVVALGLFLVKILSLKDSVMLKDIRTIFWCIKDYIDPVKLDILRDGMYQFYIAQFQEIKDPSFILEYTTLLRDMGFKYK